MKITINTYKKVFKCKEASIEKMNLLGYELIKELFVDSSGLGYENEPALTINSFENKVIALCNLHGVLTAKITSKGQFQVYVGLFKKTSKAIAKKIDNNTYKVDNDDAKYIILHDTKILEWSHDFIILNNGGYQTKTTKDRINKYLPSGVYIYQKNFEWFIKDERDNTIKPFINNMQIAN